MASLRERLLRRSAPTPTPDKSANGVEPAVENNGGTPTPPHGAVQIPQVSQVSMLSSLTSR